MFAKFFKFFSSLKLTVVCLCFALILVFAGTLAQVEHGLWDTQARYFRSLFVYWSPGDSAIKIPVLPGGYLLGWVLLLNLLAAHYTRFKFRWNKVGIFMTHFGLIFLLLGQFLTEQFQVESRMRLEEGQTKDYSETERHTELAFVNHSDPKVDKVVAIPTSLLKTGAELSHPDLPFTIKVERFEQNSRLTQRAPMIATNPPASTQGIGQQAELLPVSRATAMDEINAPSAVISFAGPGAPEGTWLMSLNLQEPQQIKIGDGTWDAELRFARIYTPYSIGLIDFRHDVYIGTDTPKNYSSRIRLSDRATGENRETTIKMNQPLRYSGTTYYQASFEKGRDDVTVLQVVHNPAWLTPYVSVMIIGLGLVLQFSMHLFKFTKKKTA